MGRFTCACLVNESGDVAFGTGLVGSRQGAVVLVDPLTGLPKGGLQLLGPPPDSVTALAAGPASSLIFVGTAGGRLAVLDTSTGRFDGVLIFLTPGNPVPATIRGIQVLRAAHAGGGFLLQASGYVSQRGQWNSSTDPARVGPGGAIVFDPSSGLPRTNATPTIPPVGGVGPRAVVASAVFLVALDATGAWNLSVRTDQRMTGGPGVGPRYTLRQDSFAILEPTLSISGSDVLFRTALPGVPSVMDPAMFAFVQGTSDVSGGIGTAGSTSLPGLGGSITLPAPVVNFMPLLGTSPSLTIPAGAAAMLVEAFNASGRRVGAFSIRGDEAGVFRPTLDGTQFVGSLVASTGTLLGPLGSGIQSACMAPEHLAWLGTPSVLCAALNASEFAKLQPGNVPSSRAMPLAASMQWEPPKGLSSSIGLSVTAPGASSELAALLPSTIAVTDASPAGSGVRTGTSFAAVFLSSGRNSSLPRRWAGCGRTSLAGPSAAAGSGAVAAFPALIETVSALASSQALQPQPGSVLPQYGLLMSSVFVEAASLPGALSASRFLAVDIAAAEGAALRAGANSSLNAQSSPTAGELPPTIIHPPPSVGDDGTSIAPPYGFLGWPKAFAFSLMAAPMQPTAQSVPVPAAGATSTASPAPPAVQDTLILTPLLVQTALPGGTVIRARTLIGLPREGPFPFALAPGGSGGGAGGSGSPALLRDIFQDGSSRSVAAGATVFRDAGTTLAVVAGWGTAYFAGGSMLAAVDLATLNVIATCLPGPDGGGNTVLTAGVLNPFTSLKMGVAATPQAAAPMVTAYFASADGSITRVANLTAFCSASSSGVPELLAAISPVRDGGLSFAIGLLFYRPPVNATLVAVREAAGLPPLPPVDYVLALLRGGTVPGDAVAAGVVAVPLGGNASDALTFGARITPPTGDPRPQILSLGTAAAQPTSFVLDPTYGHVMVTTEAAPSAGSIGAPQLIRASLNAIAPYAGMPSGRPIVWPQTLAGVGNATAPADIACILPLAGGLPPNTSTPGLGRLLAITRRVPASSDVSDYETVDAMLFSLEAPVTGSALKPASGAPMLSTRTLRLSTALPPGFATSGTVAALLGDWSRPSAAACRSLVADTGTVLAGAPLQLRSLFLAAAGFGSVGSAADGPGAGVVSVGPPSAGAATGSSAATSSRLRRQLQSSQQGSGSGSLSSDGPIVVADAAQLGVANTTLLSIDASVWFAQAALPAPATPVPRNSSGSNSSSGGGSSSGAAGGADNAEEEQLELVIYILAGAAAAVLALAAGICCSASRKVSRARADVRADAARALQRVRTADAMLRHEAAGTAGSSPAVLDGLALALTSDALLPPLRVAEDDEEGRSKRPRGSSAIRNSTENVQARVQVIVADVATELLSPAEAGADASEDLLAVSVSEGASADGSFEHAVSARGGAALPSSRRSGAASSGKRSSVSATVQRVQRSAVAAFASSLPRGALEALVNDVLQRAANVLADPIRLRAAFATAIAEDLLLERLVAAAVGGADTGPAAIAPASSDSADGSSAGVTATAALRRSSAAASTTGIALPQAAVLNAVVRACSEELLASLGLTGDDGASTTSKTLPRPSIPPSTVEALQRLDRRLWRASVRHCLPLGASSIAAAAVASADAGAGIRSLDDAAAAAAAAARHHQDQDALPRGVDAARPPAISLSTPSALPRATRRVLEFAPVTVAQSGSGAASAALSRALEEAPVRVVAMPVASRRVRLARGIDAGGAGSGSGLAVGEGEQLGSLASTAADHALTGAPDRPAPARISNPALRLQQQALLLAALAPESADEVELTADRPRAVLAEPEGSAAAAGSASRVKAAKALIESRVAEVQLRRDLLDKAQRLAASLRGDGVSSADSFVSSASAAAVRDGDDNTDDTDDCDDADDWDAPGLVVSVEEGPDSEIALGETPVRAGSTAGPGSRGSVSSGLSGFGGVHRQRSPAAAVRSGAVEKVDVNMRSAARTGVASRTRAPAISRASALPSLALEAVVLSTLQGAAAASRRTLLRYLDGDDAGAAALLAEADRDAESGMEADADAGTGGLGSAGAPHGLRRGSSRRMSTAATADASVRASAMAAGGGSGRTSRAVTRASIAAAVAAGLPASEAAGFQRVSFAALQHAGLQGWDGVWRFACPCMCAPPADTNDDGEEPEATASARVADATATATAPPLRQSSGKAAARRTSSAGRRRNLPPLFARHTAARFAQRLRGRQLAFVHQKRASFAPNPLARPGTRTAGAGASAGGRLGAGARQSMTGASESTGRAGAAGARRHGATEGSGSGSGSGDGIELTAPAHGDAASDAAIGTSSSRASFAPPSLAPAAAGPAETMLPPSLAAPLLFHRLHACGAIPGFEGFLGAPAPAAAPAVAASRSSSPPISTPLTPLSLAPTGRGDRLSLASPAATVRRKTQSGFAPLISLGSSTGELPLSATVANPMLLHRERGDEASQSSVPSPSPLASHRITAGASGGLPVGASRRRLHGSDASREGAAAGTAASRTPTNSTGSRASFVGGASFAPLATNRATSRTIK